MILCIALLVSFCTMSPNWNIYITSGVLTPVQHDTIETFVWELGKCWSMVYWLMCCSKVFFCIVSKAMILCIALFVSFCTMSPNRNIYITLGVLTPVQHHTIENFVWELGKCWSMVYWLMCCSKVFLYSKLGKDFVHCIPCNNVTQ